VLEQLQFTLEIQWW